MVIPILAEPTNLIPFLASDSASAAVSQYLFNGLVKYDDDLDLTGDLAESWDISPDGLVITFHLRKNVLWHDGVPFTAADVVFTYERIIDPKVPTPYGAKFDRVQSVEAKDRYTVIVKYREPYAPGLASWAMGIVPKHALSREDLAKTAFARSPVGTGPYLLERWVPGQMLVLTANRGYFEGRPNIDRIVARVMPDASTVFLELQAQDLDTADLTPLQHARQIDTPFFKKHFRDYRWDGFQYTYLAYNLAHPLFKDARVRRAVGLAIDRQAIIDTVLLGRGRLTSGPFIPGHWAYNEQVPVPRRDIVEAKKLLQEAGYDGRIHKLSFTVLTNSGNDTRRMVCEVVQRSLAEAGVEMRIRTVEWGVLLKEFIHPKRFEAVLMGWNLPLDPDSYDIFHSSRTGPGHFNFVSYRNADVDALLEQARGEFDRTKRAEYSKKIHKLIAADEPYSFLYAPESLALLHRRFENVKETKAGIGQGYLRWTVPVERRRYAQAALDA